MVDLQLFGPATTALIIVDMQNDFCDPTGAHGQAGVVYYPDPEGIAERIERLLAAAREEGVLPVHVRTTHDGTTDSAAWLHRKDAVGGPRTYTCATSTWGAEFWRIRPEPGEVVITKHRYSAFVGTNLDLILRSRGVTSLAVTGVATNVCVDCTLRDGLQRDYHVALVSDATAAASEQEWGSALHGIAANYGPVCSSEEILARWRTAATAERGHGSRLAI
jgi:nicotinamidase-related amidase